MQEEQARVLIIDNDIRVVNQLRPIFENRGFSVSSIGHSQPVHKDSETKWDEWIVGYAQQFRPHVAIVDLRLRNDYMDEESGLLIIPQLASAYNILYSARLTFDVVERAKEQGVYRCVAKGAKGTKKLVGALREAAALSSTQFAKINIHWPDKWDGHSVVSSIFSDDSGVPHDMPDDLILQLYKERADNAKIAGVTEQMLSQPPPSRSRSAVVKVQPIDRQPSILKLAPARRIQREQDNYNTYVAEQMQGAFHTQLVASELFWDMGGIIYSLISGQNIASFAEHYVNCSDADEIIKPLEHLFEEVWAGHYIKSVECLEDSDFDTLYDLYDVMYDFDTLFENSCMAEQFNSIENVAKAQPADWICSHRAKSRFPTARFAITHGDLHSENIFVDGEHSWLIDFERTGKGHILRDFVELEIDILTRLASSKIDLEAFVEISKVLLAPYSFNTQTESLPPPYDIAEGAKAEAKKCLDLIFKLRMIARRLVKPFSTSEYRWALLLNSIFVAYHLDKTHLSVSGVETDQKNAPQQARAFIFAQLICKYIGSEA